MTETAGLTYEKALAAANDASDARLQEVRAQPNATSEPEIFNLSYLSYLSSALATDDRNLAARDLADALTAAAMQWSKTITKAESGRMRFIGSKLAALHEEIGSCR